MLRKKTKARFSERIEPGEPEPEWCSPGSIEQQLDMCEEGDLRGDEITHLHGISQKDPPELLQVNENTGRFQILSDPDREEKDQEELRIHLLHQHLFE